MADALVSVIVPIYNTAPWLDRCVKSIVDQTYKNLEILLVDDGSTDASGSMCDLWAEKDNRVRVIHKPNGGLSSARNVGIEAAKGEYFSFVDSDDWLDLTMIDTLHTAIRDNETDMAACGFLLAYDDYFIRQHRSSNETIVLDNHETFEAVIRQSYPVSDTAVWDKLYARRLWDKVRFPAENRCEDVCVRSMIYAQCQKVTVVDKALYFYYQREGSAVHTVDVRYLLDVLEAYRYDCAVLKRHCPSLCDGANAVMFHAILSVYARIWDSGAALPEMERQIADTFRQCKKGLWKHLSFRSKIKYLLLRISPELLRRMRKLYWKTHDTFSKVSYGTSA